MHHTEHDKRGEISKSQRKRELDALKRLGRELLGLSDDALRRLRLPEELLDALLAARKINAHGALKRQLQYIGKLLRDVDTAPLREAVEEMNHQHSTHTREFHLLETLRDRLLLEGDAALPEVLAHFPHTDRQHLRRLARHARNEHATRQPPRATRQLFRYLRELQEEAGD
ncbi:MAG: ribosome biogenesis factor YjgA [Gammaproteobacteria bacterium]|jgi:ribosome-associated protein